LGRAAFNPPLSSLACKNSNDDFMEKWMEILLALLMIALSIAALFMLAGSFSGEPQSAEGESGNAAPSSDLQPQDGGGFGGAPPGMGGDFSGEPPGAPPS
jgi:hypothetical protein